MSSQLVATYVDLLGGDRTAELVLMACAASLRLDDEKAATAINLVAATNGTTGDFVRRVKSLGCVSRQWDGTWYLLEDVRVPLVARFEAEVSEEIRARVRQELAVVSDRRLEEFRADGQLTEYRSRRVRFEAAYQRVLMPGSNTAAAASRFTEIWSALDGPGKSATAKAVDYLAPEIERSARRLPPEILFLRGMAARARREHARARDFFRQVWEQGRPGEIFGIAAHLFGTSTSDWKLGERALRDSLAWYHSAHHQVLVWHSLGVLLSKNRRRWKDAEEAYWKSLRLDNDPSSQAKTWHSLGNLLAKDRKRWKNAEEAYSKSLQLDNNLSSQAKTWHSLGNLLAKDRKRWKAAEEAYGIALELGDQDTKAQTWHSLGNLLAKDPERWEAAEEAYGIALELGDEDTNAQTWHSLGNLLARDPERWNEAENAYRTSIKLLNRRADIGQVHASWADGLWKTRGLAAAADVEKHALLGLELAPDNPKTAGVAHRILAALYEAQDKPAQAIREIMALQETDRRLGEERYDRELNERLAKLRERLG
jgi:tetratricopeptide (TPR) repeat protein